MGASREKSQEVEWIRAEKLKSGLQRCVLMAAVALGLEKPQVAQGNGLWRRKSSEEREVRCGWRGSRGPE